MNQLFIDRIDGQGGHWGDFTGEALRYAVSIRWTPERMVIPLESRRFRLMTGDGAIHDCIPGSSLSWTDIRGAWKLIPTDSELELFKGATVPVDSMEMWRNLMPVLDSDVRQVLKGTDFLLSFLALRGELSLEDVFFVQDHLDALVLEGRVEIRLANDHLKRWGRFARPLCLQAMRLPQPDPRAVHWLQSHPSF